MDNRTAGEIKWPSDNCPYCEGDLTQTEPRAYDKALAEDGSGELKWADFCPHCHHGIIVGDRFKVTPRKVSAKMEDVGKKVPANAPAGRKVAEAPALSPENTYEPGQETAKTERNLVEGQYFCTKCGSNHKENSKVGKRHIKNREA